jgi:hypothetical protein
MKDKKILMIAIVAGVFAFVAAISAQDKYTEKVPGELAFSEFRGYEAWQAISISRSEKAVAVIVGNPAMIDAYRTGIPANGKPVPDGAKMAKVHWTPKPNEFVPDATVPGKLLNVDFMVKDSERFADSGGMGIRRVRLGRCVQYVQTRYLDWYAAAGKTMPSAGSRAIREQRREITFSPITANGRAVDS